MEGEVNGILIIFSLKFTKRYEKELETKLMLTVILNYLNLKQLIKSMENDVIQYTWPMMGQYTFCHWPIKMYTGIGKLSCITSFFIGTKSCFINL